MIIRRERVVAVPLDVIAELVEAPEMVPAKPSMTPRPERLSRRSLGRLQLLEARWSPKDNSIEIFLLLESLGPVTRVVLESRHTPSGMVAGVRARLVGARRVGKALDRALNLLGSAGG